nr:MAG TPA: hypothetical protein [Crassvirales sp.]
MLIEAKGLQFFITFICSPIAIIWKSCSGQI